MNGRETKVNKNRKTKTVKVNKKAKPTLDQNAAALRIQMAIRRFVARRRVKRLANEVWTRVFDPTYKRYFWFDKLHNASMWKQPKHVELYSANDIAAVARIQKIVRGFIDRCKTKRLVNEVYTRYFDMENSRFYWLDHRTQKTTHRASPWLQRQNVKMPMEDQLLLQSQLRIKELERKLAEKENEIKEIRKQRYEDLEPQVIRDKVKKAENLERSRHMDEWSTDDLAAWLIELKMEQYIPNIYANRVDGRLFLSLTDNEYVDLGIQNKFHLRKLQLILKAFKARYQRKRDKLMGKEDEGEDEELLSEYSPSELSAILAEQDRMNGEEEESEEGSDDRSSLASDEDEEVTVTEEQKLQKAMDSENIKSELIMKGDGVNFPMVGDIVRVKYQVILSQTGRVLMSTKNTLERPWVEFVLGIGQVITGFDHCLPMMSIGERSKHTFTPQYAYGEKGLFPHIPPNATLTFDITLLEYRPRSTWVKPLIQDLQTTNEKPYLKDLKLSLEKAHALGQGHRIAQVLSASLLLNEGVDYHALNSRDPGGDGGSVQTYGSH